MKETMDENTVQPGCIADLNFNPQETEPFLCFNRPFPIPRFLAVEERTSPNGPSDPCCSGW